MLIKNTVNISKLLKIPPALHISQCNITNYFSGKNIFEYRPFSSFLEIKEEFDSADIVFITPEQLQLIPENSVHLSLAIDCLHEMKCDTVELFFSHFDRISKFLYFKCQISQWAKTSKINLDMDSYPVKSHWVDLSKEKCYIPNSYFHANYCMRSNHLKQHDNHIKEEVLN